MRMFSVSAALKKEACSCSYHMIEAVSALFPLLWILDVTVIYFFAGYSPNMMSFLPKRHNIVEALRSSVNHSAVRVPSLGGTQPGTFRLLFPQPLLWLKPHIEPHGRRCHTADVVAIVRKAFATFESILAQINDIIGIVSCCFPPLRKLSSWVNSSQICCRFLLTGVHMQPLIYLMILVWTLRLSGKAHCAF